MTQKEKQLLLRDLCARLPYGIKILHRGAIEEIVEITLEGSFQNRSYNAWFDISTCKPYLRPMSSMTEEERQEYGLVLCDEVSINQYDWLNAHHFDYRNLIEKGLALEAPKDMYNFNNKEK